jgi:hypothetical protein
MTILFVMCKKTDASAVIAAFTKAVSKLMRRVEVYNTDYFIPAKRYCSAVTNLT